MGSSRTSALLLASILMLGFSCGAHAQPTSAAAATAAFREKLDQLSRQIQTVEQQFSVVMKRIESSSRLTAADFEAPELDKAMEAYADALKADVEEALADADTWAKTNGREGNAAKLTAYEAVVKGHEARMAAIQKRADALYSKIKSGAVTLDAAMLASFSTADRAQFGDFLSPAGRKHYPADLVPGSRTSLEVPRFAALNESFKALAPTMTNLKACTDWVAGSVITPAGAAMAAGCAAACAFAWPSCIACVGLVAGLTVQNWNVFKTCWSGSAKGRWTPLWLWRTKCVAFLTLLVG